MALSLSPDEGLSDADTTGMGGAPASGSTWSTADTGMALQGGGGVLGAFGALYAGEMESSALDAQANIQRQNAALDLGAGNANAARSQIMSGQRIGAIQGAAAAGGVAQSGSVLSVMAASSMNAEMDRQNILHGAQVRAIQADNQATMDSMGAQSALTGSYFKALGSVVGSGSQIAADMSGG